MFWPPLSLVRGRPVSLDRGIGPYKKLRGYVMKILSQRKLYFVLSLACACVVLSSTVFGQDKDWRPISPEELSAKTAVVEPNADAEAMFWEVRIDDSSADGITLSHYVRVKVFTERGREKYSKFDIPFIKGMKIRDLAARVTRGDGS